jgi:DNA-binding NarL/FixJ family response regulator
MIDLDVLKVLIADGHEVFRNELRDMLGHAPDIQVVGVCPNAGDAIRRVCSLRPHGLDLVLMDIYMPVVNGIEATRKLAVLDPALPIVILTDSTFDRDLFAAISAGAVGYLSKSLSRAALIQTLRDFRDHGSLPMSRVMASKAIAYLKQQHAMTVREQAKAVGRLSLREREVIGLIATGAHDQEIAAALNVRETTVKTHVRHILRKLGARNRTEALVRSRTDRLSRPDGHLDHLGSIYY